jgi:hypothetical protein
MELQEQNHIVKKAALMDFIIFYNFYFKIVNWIIKLVKLLITRVLCIKYWARTS